MRLSILSVSALFFTLPVFTKLCFARLLRQGMSLSVVVLLSACSDNTGQQATSDAAPKSSPETAIESARESLEAAATAIEEVVEDLEEAVTTDESATLALSNQPVTIISNATIHSGSKDTPKLTAFAYRAGKIIATGELDALQNNYPEATQIDLFGQTVVPGFIDAHGHLLGLGESLINIDLVGTTSKQDILKRLSQGAESLSEGQWLLGRGWDQNDWPEANLPSAADLDALFPNRPVWLERIDGHANWANSAAMQFVAQDLQGDWQPDGGEIIRDASGEPTGVFIDNAVNLIQQQVPLSSKAEQREALRRAMQKLASVGITGMHDAGTSLATWELLQEMQSEEPLTLRVYAMADGNAEMLDHLCRYGTAIDPIGYLNARAVKLYSDGALGSRGAALLEDYSDAPNNKGLLIESKETLTMLAKRAIECGLQVNIHAIGDRGNRVTLDVLEASIQNYNPGRHRIEHSQVVALSDFHRFKELGLIASVQPTHATSDMPWAETRVGTDRIKGAYAWQRFVEIDVPLALGSDFPVEKADPLLGFYAAVTRQNTDAKPEQGWYPSQRLSREQALHGFTLGAAYAAFQEEHLGSLEVGKQADFVVLSKDIMTVPSEDILTTKIVATYVAGEAVFETSAELPSPESDK